MKILRGLDRESTPSYELRVKAEDQGTPRRLSTALYTVTVDDANDNSPQFAADQVKTLSVREDQTAGEVLLTLTASDADTGMYHAMSYVSTDIHYFYVCLHRHTLFLCLSLIGHSIACIFHNVCVSFCSIQ